ncbi:MAG: ribonuclease M5 [Peptostreptococcaceae bacterium]|nr:ribonuclease M5 [Peptostreptococcaceae bacterium]
MNKINVSEAIVVEGRDDTTAVSKAVEGITIETHGFGIKKETWTLIEKAYKEKGIIIFTDPDFSGEEIRRKLTERFPNAKQAYLPLEKALKNGNIGIENASGESIIEALSKCHCKSESSFSDVDTEFLYKNGLLGKENSSKLREELCDILGIGYSNGKTLLKKLVAFNINKSDINNAIKEINNDKRK